MPKKIWAHDLARPQHPYATSGEILYNVRVKAFKGLQDSLHLGRGHLRIDREADYLLRGFLGGWEIVLLVTQVGEPRLEVEGEVDGMAYTPFLQVFLQAVPVVIEPSFTSDWRG